MRHPTLTTTTCFLFLSAAFVLAAPARAGEPETSSVPSTSLKGIEEPHAPPAPLAPSWYGWQIMLVDAASFICVGATEQEACLAGYAVGGPTVHALHGRPARAIVSLGLRVGLPVAGGLIGAAVANCPEPPPAVTTVREVDGGTITTTSGGWSLCGLSEIGLGAMVGAAAAMVVDGVMAFSGGASEPTPESTKPGRFALAPRLAIGKDNVAMGLGGTF